MIYNNKGRMVRLLASLGGNRNRPIIAPKVDDDFTTNNDPINPHDLFSGSSQKKITKREQLILFFKGLVAWGLCYFMGYTFDQAARNLTDLSHSEINSSAAFALLMHTMGFSSFLLYTTGKLRWVLLNGIISLILLLIFNHTGMTNNWIIFSTHSIGYILLIIVIIIMVLIFGGVVLVWSQLIDFLKQILIKYPHVKNEILENKVLEQVLIEYIADLPNSNPMTSKILQVVKDFGPIDEELNPAELTSESIVETEIESQQQTQLHSQHSMKFNDSNELNEPKISKKQKKKNELAILQSYLQHCTILSGRKTNCCYFCLKTNPKYLIPSCEYWNRNLSTNNNLIPMCTPYTNLVQERDETIVKYQQIVIENEIIEKKLIINNNKTNELSNRLQNNEQQLQVLIKQQQQRIADIKQQNELFVQELLIQHNSQITEIKNMNKIMKLKLNELIKYQKNQSINENNLQNNNNNNKNNSIINENEINNILQTNHSINSKIIINNNNSNKLKIIKPKQSIIRTQTQTQTIAAKEIKSTIINETNDLSESNENEIEIENLNEKKIMEMIE